MRRQALLSAVLLPLLSGTARGQVTVPQSNTVSGYVTTLLINETPFPGERGWQSEADTEAAMLAILWVLECRLNHIPLNYTQAEIAAQRCKDVIDVITAGGEKGQCDGFCRDSSGRPVTAPRVKERRDFLLTCANRGKPGRFARLLNYATALADHYVRGGIEEADRFAGLSTIGNTHVTGRAYGWMTDREYFHPGGNFVRIPDEADGSLGGNRFFTLKRKQ